MENVRIEDLADAKVGEALDLELRGLLSVCFPKDVEFTLHRHFQEKPAHRWMGRDEAGRLMGHVCIHDKMLGSCAGDLRIGGVAEVCVHPDFRGRGLVRTMLGQVHPWLAERGFDFAMLFGREAVYTSSGYRTVENMLRYYDLKQKQWMTQAVAGAMVRPLGQRAWPEQWIDLRGPVF